MTVTHGSERDGRLGDTAVAAVFAKAYSLIRFTNPQPLRDWFE